MFNMGPLQQRMSLVLLYVMQLLVLSSAKGEDLQCGGKATRFLLILLEYISHFTLILEYQKVNKFNRQLNLLCFVHTKRKRM